MNDTEVMQEFRDSGAILDGHFILSSGLHSRTYMQCAKLLVDPARARRVAQAIADKVRQNVADNIDIVVAPAMGGVVIGALVAQALEKPYIFCEREQGVFRFRRGLSMPESSKALVVEDVVTTGLSSREAFVCIAESGGKTVAEACIANRNGSDVIENLPLISLCRPVIETFSPDAVPDDLKHVKAVKPGSRTLRSVSN